MFESNVLSNIVTGAGGVIGSQVATSFGKEGNKVVLADVNLANLTDIVAEINAGQGQAFAYQVDVRSYDQVKAMIDETLKRWQRIDVMACVAGGSYVRLLPTERPKLLIDYTDEEWNLVIDTNLNGPFHCIKAVAKCMMAQKDGNIIVMGSGVGSKGKAGYSNYAASKAGLIGLMKSAALELGEYNVKVNAVIPGIVLHEGESIDGYLTERNTLKRTNSAIEVAKFYVSLSKMDNVSGQVFHLDCRILY